MKNYDIYLEERCNAINTLEVITNRLQNEIDHYNQFAELDLEEYTALATAYAKAERLYLELLKEEESEGNHECTA